MKRSIRVLSVVLCLLMMASLLAACGGKKLSGTYTAEVAGTGTELTFSGSKVTLSVKVLGTTVGDPIEGTYEIKDDKITITFESDKDEAKKLSGTSDFSEEDGKIKIGVVTYTKADKK